MKVRCLLSVTLATCLCAQEILTNDTILKLVKAGVGDDVIVGMVNQQSGRYLLSADSIIALKTGGVSDKVISAMIVRNGASSAAPTPTAMSPAPMAASSAPLILHDATPIRLRLNRNLSSSDATTGDSVDFEALDDLKIDDVLVIARGATAIATVTDAEHKKRMARGGKLDVNIDYVRLVNGDKVTLRAVKDVKGGGHTGAMTGAMVATSLVFFPAAPFFLFMHGKDVTIPKGTEITAYVDGEIKLERAKFISGPPLPTPVAQYVTPVAAATAFAPPHAPPPSNPVIVLSGSQRETSVVTLPAPTPQATASQPSQPVAAVPAVTIPAPSQPPTPAVVTVPPIKPVTPQADAAPHTVPPAPTPQADPKPVPTPTPASDADPKLNLTITSDPAGAAVEINGVSVGATPIAVGLTPGTACTIAIKKDGFVQWKMNYPTSAAGKYSLNANLTQEVFH